MNAGAERFLEQVQRSSHVGVDEILTRVGDDVRLVERGGMDHGVDAAHGRSDEAAIGNGADELSERRCLEIETDRTVALLRERAHQRLAEVSGASGDEEIYHDRPGQMRSR